MIKLFAQIGERRKLCMPNNESQQKQKVSVIEAVWLTKSEMRNFELKNQKLVKIMMSVSKTHSGEEVKTVG